MWNFYYVTMVWSKLFSELLYEIFCKILAFLLNVLWSWIYLADLVKVLNKIGIHFTRHWTSNVRGSLIHLDIRQISVHFLAQNSSMAVHNPQQWFFKLGGKEEMLYQSSETFFKTHMVTMCLQRRVPMWFSYFLARAFVHLWMTDLQNKIKSSIVLKAFKLLSILFCSTLYGYFCFKLYTLQIGNNLTHFVSSLTLFLAFANAVLTSWNISFCTTSPGHCLFILQVSVPASVILCT